ncbi:MAG: XRE family transcriptional regulator [Clostridia bacterium]|nr:XRE family transcriptional regulator [Clostridia bacterium]NCD04040.1 XRE family transcriptional regulator [Clostridia bacterium]
MERAKIIRQIMEEKGMKVSDIAKATGIAYSTVKSILENGIGKTSYSNVCLICEALEITPDRLEQIEKENAATQPTTIAAHFDGTEYTEEQLERIKAFAAFIKTEK